MCVPCRLTTRLDTVLDDGSGTPNPALAPLAAHLLVSPRPLAALQTLYKRHTVALLSALATGRIPLTHEGLHAWPHPTAVQHLRHRLITCGVLAGAEKCCPSWSRPSTTGRGSYAGRRLRHGSDRR